MRRLTWELHWLARRIHCAVAGHVWTELLTAGPRQLRCDECGVMRYV